MDRRADIHEPDDPAWLVGERRREVLAPLVAAPRTTAAAVDEAARELGIKRAYCNQCASRRNSAAASWKGAPARNAAMSPRTRPIIAARVSCVSEA